MWCPSAMCASSSEITEAMVGFVARHGVDQALADQDGVADGRGFDGVGQHDPAVHRQW